MDTDNPASGPAEYNYLTLTTMPPDRRAVVTAAVARTFTASGDDALPVTVVVSARFPHADARGSGRT